MASLQKKICLLGDFAVGKTSLVRRFVEGIFGDEYLSTVGAKIDRKTLFIQQDVAEPVELTMLIWDLAGGEKFDRVISSYYRGAAGAILVCDLTRPETLKILVRYAHDFWNVNPRAFLVVVANKADLVAQRAICDEEVAVMAAEYHSPWFISSAKTGENVALVFQVLGQRILTPIST